MIKRQEQIRAEKLSYWGPNVQQWLLSGIKTKAYYNQHGLNHDQFKYWQYQLAPESRKQSKKPASSPKLNLFSELKPRNAEPIFKEVALKIGNGYSVTLSGDFDNQVILKVLSALEGR